jgi:hypothetical protein
MGRLTRAKPADGLESEPGDRRPPPPASRLFSRHDETRRHAVIELTADGTDYIMTTLLPGMESTETWDAMFLVLSDANEPMTQREIRRAWPDDFARPDRSTIVRHLGRALEENRIRRKGTGRKNDPYKYWAPEVEDGFNPPADPPPEQHARHGLYWQKKMWGALGIDTSGLTLEQFMPKKKPAAEPTSPLAVRPPRTAEPVPWPTAEPESPPQATIPPELPPVVPAPPIMPPSPTEYIPVETAPLPPLLLRPPPPVDEAALEAERIRLRIRR